MIRVGQIGCGYFGRFHLNAWQRMDDVHLVGVAERSEKRRKVLREHYPALALFDHGDALLETGPFDLIDIASPPATHAALIRQMIGKVPAVICQKPFCEDLSTARTITDEAQAAGMVLVVHENFRFMPWYRQIKKLIEAGSLGRVRHAHFRLRPGDGAGPDAYCARQPYFRKMDRFLVHETGVHWIDTFRYLFGEPTSVYADLWQENPAIKGEDAGHILFRFDDGVRVIFDANRTLDHAADNHRLTMGEFTIEGEEATLDLDGKARLFLRNSGEKARNPVPYTFQDIDFAGDCVYSAARHVIEHLKNGAPLETVAPDYLKNLEIEEIVYASAESGKRLNVSARED